MWCWKKDLALKDVDKDAWEAYSKSDSDAIEAAFQQRLKSNNSNNDNDSSSHFKLNETYSIDFGKMFQYQTKDTRRKRAIKRVETTSTTTTTTSNEFTSTRRKLDDTTKDQQPLLKRRRSSISYARSGVSSISFRFRIFEQPWLDVFLSLYFECRTNNVRMLIVDFDADVAY